MNSTQYIYLGILVSFSALALSVWAGIHLGEKYYKWRMRKKRPCDVLLTESYINLHKLDIYELRTLVDNREGYYIHQICRGNIVVYIQPSATPYVGALLLFENDQYHAIQWYRTFEGVSFKEGDKVAVTFQVLKVAKTISSNY